MMVKKNYLFLVILSCLLLSSIALPVNAVPIENYAWNNEDVGINYSITSPEENNAWCELQGKTACYDQGHYLIMDLQLVSHVFGTDTFSYAGKIEGSNTWGPWSGDYGPMYGTVNETMGYRFSCVNSPPCNGYNSMDSYNQDPYEIWNLRVEASPATTRNITVNLKNLAGQALSSIPVEIYPNDLSDYTVGSTDINGNYTASLNIGSNTSTHIHVVSYDIYEAQDWDFNFDSTPWYHQMILFQSVPTSTYYNITYHVQSNTGLMLSGVQVTHYVSPDFYYTLYTGTNGNVTFYNTPALNNYATYHTSRATYQDSNGAFTFTGDMDKTITLYPIGVTTPTVTPTPSGTGYPTVTPTPIGTGVPFDTWTLEAAPNAISLGESSVLVAYNTNNVKTTAEGGLRTVFYYEKNIGAGMTQVGAYKYNSTSLDWDFRIGNTAAWQYSTSFDPMLCTITPTRGGSIQYFVTTFDINQVSMGAANCYIDVGGAGVQGSLNVVISANEATTTNHISNWNMDISNDLTGIHEVYTVDYTRTLTLSRGQTYTIIATKEGYEEATKQFTVTLDTNVHEGDGGAVVTVPMFLIGSTSAGNTTVTVHVNDAETYYPVGNVRIYINGYGAKFTGGEGESASFSIPQNTGVTIAASKDGYCSVEEYKNTSTLDYLYVPMFIKYGQCAGVTPIHTPIPNSTPVIITPTPIGGYGNLSGSATVCNRSAVYNGDIAGYIKNSLACMGIVDLLSQNLAFASLIILIFGLIGAKYAKGVGFALGAVIGATISMALNLIPFWLIAILVILMVLVAFLLIGRNSGG